MRWLLFLVVLLSLQLVVAELSDFSVTPSQGPIGTEVVVSAKWVGSAGNLFLFDYDNNQLGAAVVCSDSIACHIERTVFPETSTSFYPFFQLVGVCLNSFRQNNLIFLTPLPLLICFLLLLE